METAPRRFVKPLAPPVVADRSEMEGLSRIKDLEVREQALCSGRPKAFLSFGCGSCDGGRGCGVCQALSRALLSCGACYYRLVVVSRPCR